jgi:transcriptional regulator with XRE-family HTH domain
MRRPTLGGQIRTFREHQGLVQAELAIRLGCSALLISRWERDEILPTTTELTALAEALGCRILISEDSISLIRVPRPEEPLNGHVRSRQGLRE